MLEVAAVSVHNCPRARKDMVRVRVMSSTPFDVECLVRIISPETVGVLVLALVNPLERCACAVVDEVVCLLEV